MIKLGDIFSLGKIAREQRPEALMSSMPLHIIHNNSAKKIERISIDLKGEMPSIEIQLRYDERR